MSTSTNKLHIYAPHLVSRRRRLSDAVVTGAMWVLYSYLWAPFISLVAWLLGFEFAYDVMVRAGGIRALKDVLSWYAIVLACICIVIPAWSTLNRHRFAYHDRRLSGKNIGDEELAEHFALDRKYLTCMRSARITRVSLSDTGSIEQVDALAMDSIIGTDAAITTDRIS